MLARDEFEAGSRWLMVGIAIVVVGILLLRKYGVRSAVKDMVSLPRSYLEARAMLFFLAVFAFGGVCIAIGVGRLLR